jgi:hypothetical protein
MISSKHECVFIRDLSDSTLRTIFDAWWALINVGPNDPIAGNNSGLESSWGVYLHSGIEETRHPGIKCIVPH